MFLFYKSWIVNCILEALLFLHFYFTLLLLIIIKIDYKRYDKIIDAKLQSFSEK